MLRNSLLLGWAIAIFFGAFCVSSLADTASLTPQVPIVVPRVPGFFDYMEVDDKYRRLLVSHSGSRTLDIIDLTTETVARQVDVGEAHGIALDVKDGRYYIGTGRPSMVVDIQRKFMVKQNQIPMGGTIDAVAFDSKSDALYADRADTGQVVVIDGQTRKILTNITIGGDLEFVVYDPVSDRIYQNVVSTNVVAVIDPKTNAVVASWPAAPAHQLRGLAVDGATHRLFTAGGNGKLAVMDTTSGSVIAVVAIAPGVDQIDFDPGTKRIYCASGTGLLSVVQETDTGAESLGDVTVPRHAHTVAVDPTTHNVWISYGAADNDYVMKLVQASPSPSPAPSSST